MGLDQYAYVAMYPGQRDEYYASGKCVDGQWHSTVDEARELAYWRKHPNLQGWMELLWESKGRPSAENTGAIFNCVELELTWEDVDRLEKDIKSGKVSELGTQGFFFGNPSDDYYREYDLKFCINAKAELFLGLRVFYNSSW